MAGRWLLRRIAAPSAANGRILRRTHRGGPAARLRRPLLQLRLLVLVLVRRRCRGRVLLGSQAACKTAACPARHTAVGVVVAHTAAAC